MTDELRAIMCDYREDREAIMWASLLGEGIEWTVTSVEQVLPIEADRDLEASYFRKLASVIEHED